MHLAMLDTVLRQFYAEHVPFVPTAIWQDGLDQIIVVTRDRSFTEIHPVHRLPIIFLEVDSSVTGDDTYAGFIIDGARAYCEKHKLIHEGSVNLSELLSSLTVTFREDAIYVDLARQIAERHGITTVTMA